MRLSTKDHLLDRIKTGGEEQNQAILQLWKLTDQKCRRIIRKGRGSIEDQEDTRQEATLLLFEALKDQKFRGNTDRQLIAFFNQTFLFVWMAKVRKRDQMPTSELDKISNFINDNIEEWLIEQEGKRGIYGKLEACLKKLDEKGRQIIQWRYFQKPALSWTDIAQNLSYQTIQAAQNKGGKGMKKLRLCMNI